mgnify:CR=1 FL=1
MFGLFKKTSELEKLEKKYKKLMKEAYEIQSINRRESDSKYAEAEEILKQIEKLKTK